MPKKYRVPISGFILVQAESAEEAINVADRFGRTLYHFQWARTVPPLAEIVNYQTVTGEVTLPVPPQGLISCFIDPTEAEDITEDFDREVTQGNEHTRARLARENPALLAELTTMQTTKPDS